MVKKISGINEIDGNTIIIFTIRTFLATLGTILGIFFGFYQMVVIPKIDASEKHYQAMFDSEIAQNSQIFQKLNNIDNSITSLNIGVQNLKAMHEFPKKLSINTNILPPYKPDSLTFKETYAYQSFIFDQNTAYICKKEDEGYLVN